VIFIGILGYRGEVPALILADGRLRVEIIRVASGLGEIERLVPELPAFACRVDHGRHSTIRANPREPTGHPFHARNDARWHAPTLVERDQKSPALPLSYQPSRDGSTVADRRSLLAGGR
jgi:hypothetical protein